LKSPLRFIPLYSGLKIEVTESVNPEHSLLPVMAVFRVHANPPDVDVMTPEVLEFLLTKTVSTATPMIPSNTVTMAVIHFSSGTEKFSPVWGGA